MGMKGVVRKETLVAEDSGSVAIDLSANGLRSLALSTLSPKTPPFVLTSHVSHWPRPETTWV